MPLNQRGLVELIDMLKKGEVSPLDVARDLVDAVDKRDSTVHSYLEFYKDDVLTKAKQLTESGDFKTTRFCGLPITLKDNITVQARRTTCGSKILKDFISPYDATVAKRLEADGAIICGKANLDEFAMGSSTENSGFGVTRNPWNPEHIPGGSSGGSAAAVAADLAIAALGSDTGGSIRQPASYCGVVGMKPTYGRVSRYGLVAFASSLDQIGPIAKSVEDCGFLLSSISGMDRHDSTSLDAPVPDFTKGLNDGFGDLRIGVPMDFLEVGMDEDVRANFLNMVDALKKEKVTIVDISMPNAQYAVACYYIIANAEASSNLARYDGVKYGHRTDKHEDLYTMYTRSRDEGFGDEVIRRVLLGTYVLSAGYYDAYYLKAQKVRSLIIQDFNAAFDICDLVMIPTAPSTAFKIGEKKDDPLQMYLSDIFTIPVNLAGLPGISVPSGVSESGLPYGVQFIGRGLDEATVLRGAAGLERLVDFRRAPVV